jgi:hypothetical protein
MASFRWAQQVRKFFQAHFLTEVGPTAAFYSCIPTGIRGSTCFFWANLTPFSLQGSFGTVPNKVMPNTFMAHAFDLQVGLYLIVTSQYSSTALYQISYHIQ